MTTHQLQLVRTALQELRGAQGDVVMRCAVEAVTADALLLVELVGQAVKVGVSRQRVMERRVEDRDMGHGGKQTAHLANAGDHHRIVQRRERIERFDFREQFVGDERAFREFLAAVHDAMDDQTHFTCAADDAGLLRAEFGRHYLERLREAAFRQLAFDSLPPMRDPRWTSLVPLIPMRSTWPRAWRDSSAVS